MWDRAVDGRILHFHLVGLNNQNLHPGSMRRPEAGGSRSRASASWARLKGQRLSRISSDARCPCRHGGPNIRRARRSNLTRATSIRDRTGRRSSSVSGPPHRLAGPIPPRELVVGVEVNGVAAAYPLEALRERNPLNVEVAGEPVVFVVGTEETACAVSCGGWTGRSWNSIAAPRTAA